ncbi:unnamed protein product [Penicillium salamii]|nr:unnamed protein product [Penicillium salamii]CAG8256460.1 unnamed protein product [Penicillium salamii]
MRTVKLLLNNGVEIDSIDDMYTIPLSWLIQTGRDLNQAATIDYLRMNGATRRDITQASIKRKNTQVLP